MTNEEAIRIAQGLITDFKCESDTMVDFCNTVIKALKGEPNGDVISKQAVLDIFGDVMDYWKEHAIDVEPHEIKDALIEQYEFTAKQINELPPVIITPLSLGAFYEDAISRQYLLDNCVVDKVSMPYVPVNRIKEAPPFTPIRAKGEWVPVSEELPKERGTYEVTLQGIGELEGTDNEVAYATWFGDGNNWLYHDVDDWKDKKVIAWKPLSTPYRPQRSEE